MPDRLSRCRRLLLLIPPCFHLVAASTTTLAQTPLTLSGTATATASPLPDPNDNRYVPPLAIERTPVGYPEMAHLNRLEGVVRVRFSIDENGVVTKAIVVRSGGSLLLDSLVRDPSLLRWKFQPATFDGKPVPSTKDQEFEFRLDPAEEKAIALKRLVLPVGTPNAPYPKEAMALKPRGSATVSVRWTKGGLVDQIALTKGSGSNILDHAAVRWAYENWHVDPATLNDKNKDEPFNQTMDFVPPP